MKIIYLSIASNIILIGILLFYIFNPLPTLELVKNIERTKFDGFTGNNTDLNIWGSSGGNTIKISLSHREECSVLYHEYGHYVYDHLSKKDREYFINNVYDNTTYEGYKEDRYHTEYFATYFDLFLRGKKIQHEDYFVKVYKNYIR